MDILYEIVKVISPACITGLVTFWVTKYNYNRNIPIDKLEITYNRVYYPIFYKIRNDEEAVHVIEACEIIFTKYNKYIDQTTRVAFRYLKNNPSDKKAYSNFKDNIYSFNSKLRRRLGYLEPNFFNTYKYLAPDEKRMIRISIELIIICLFIQIIIIFHYKLIQKIVLMMLLFLLIIFMSEIIIGSGIKAYQKVKVFLNKK